MITHAAFPKTLLYCFIGPLPRRFLFVTYIIKLQGRVKTLPYCFTEWLP